MEGPDPFQRPHPISSLQTGTQHLAISNAFLHPNTRWGCFRRRGPFRQVVSILGGVLAEVGLFWGGHNYPGPWHSRSACVRFSFALISGASPSACAVSALRLRVPEYELGHACGGDTTLMCAVRVKANDFNMTITSRCFCPVCWQLGRIGVMTLCFQTAAA